MKKILFTSASILGLMSLAATAGQPENPGKFGRDRADFIHENFQNGGAMDTAPGASEWGHIASERGSTNGEQNRAYRDAVGASPTHGNDDGQDNGDETTN
jgi:hypothetical protein